MTGAITGRDVLRHPLLIVRLWGVGTYVRCIRAALSITPTTFLEVVSGAAMSGQADGSGFGGA